MSPLDLNKDPEIVPNETNEVTEFNEVIETNEVAETETNIEVTEVNLVSETTEVNEVAEEEIVTEVAEEVSNTEATPEESLETVVAEQPKAEQPITPDYSTSTKQELIDVLKLLIDKEVDAVKDDVEVIKQLFYKKTKAEIEEQKKKFVEDGGEESDFFATKDPLEESFKLLLNNFKAKKATLLALLEKEKDSNLLQKQHLLEQMKVLADSSDDVSTHINEFRVLQQKWKTIGQVPASSSTEMWKQYNL